MSKVRTVKITKRRKITHHGRHAAATALTCGMWGPVWASFAAWHAAGPRRTTRTTITTWTR